MTKQYYVCRKVLINSGATKLNMKTGRITPVAHYENVYEPFTKEEIEKQSSFIQLRHLQDKISPK